MIGVHREWKEEGVGYVEPDNDALHRTFQNLFFPQTIKKITQAVHTRHKINYRSATCC